MHSAIASSSTLSGTTSVIPQKRTLDLSADDGIRCKCGLRHDDGFSIGCDTCERWCHGACFKIFPGVNEPEHWVCWECERKGKGRQKRRKSSPVIVVDDLEEHTYTPITQDMVNPGPALERLRAQASSWRGVTGLTPVPSHLRTSPDSTDSILPPSYTLHTSSPVEPETYLTPFVSSITPAATYLADPLNAYASLGMPKPFVHLVGPPLDVALDSRISGNDARWVRSGCRPNAVLRPMLCEPTAEKLSFGLFATKALEKDEEIVLAWEWDDGSVIHQLPALLSCPDMFKATEQEHLLKQMTNVVHALESTFAKCACGKGTKGECAIERMRQFVDHDKPEVGAPPDLGPLVGAQRGFRTQEKVPMSGGMGGVEMCPSPAEPELVPPRMRKRPQKFTASTTAELPVTSPTSAFANLSLASPFVHTQTTKDQMQIDTDVPSTPSLIFTSTSNASSSLPSPPAPSPPSQSTELPKERSRSPPSLPAALSRRRNTAQSVHFDVEMEEPASEPTQTKAPPSQASPTTPVHDLPTPRSISTPRSLQAEPSPSLPECASVTPSEPVRSADSPVVESEDEDDTPMVHFEPSPVTESDVPLPTMAAAIKLEADRSPSPLLNVHPSPSPPPVACRSPSPPSTRYSPLSSAGSAQGSVVKDTSPNPIPSPKPRSPTPDPNTKALSPPEPPPKQPTPPLKEPNENSPPVGSSNVKKTSIKDYARRRKEQREKETQDKVLGVTGNIVDMPPPPSAQRIPISSSSPVPPLVTTFTAPIASTSKPPPISKCPPSQQPAPSPRTPAGPPPSWLGDLLSKDPLPPELKMQRRLDLPPELRMEMPKPLVHRAWPSTPRTPASQYPPAMRSTPAPDPVPPRSPIALTPPPMEPLPSPRPFEPSPPPFSSRLSESYSPEPHSPQAFRPSPSASGSRSPMSPSSHPYARPPSEAPMSPTNDPPAGYGPIHGRRGPLPSQSSFATAPRARMSPPRSKFGGPAEDGEIVQPPRFPRSMAGPVMGKPIPSGPRAMRGIR